MKILNVNNTLDPVNGGGSAERTLQVSRFLAELGEDCTVLSLDTGVTDKVREKAGRARMVVLPCRIERYFVPSLSWDTLSDLVCSADIIQMMNHWTLLNAMVFRYAMRFKKPYILSPAGAIPIYGRSRALKGLYDTIIGKRIIGNAKACVAISPKEIPYIKEYGVPGDRIFVIPNGIDPEDYLKEDDEGFRKKYGLTDAPFILYMGRLNQIKGPDLLLDAFIRVVRSRDIPHHLVFAGPDGGMLNELQAVSVRNGLEKRVHFLGYVGNEDRSHAYHAAEFLVIPSRQEAMSIVVLESGIAGTPVLITDTCGFDDVASIGGGVIEAASVDGLQKGMEAMMGDPAGFKTMGEKLKRFVNDNYLWEQAARKYMDLFVRVLG